MVALLNTPKKKKGFLDFFPTPSFLELSKVGLALSDEDIRLIEFKKSKKDGDLVLNCFECITLNRGVISSGYIYDKDAFIKAIKDLKKKYYFDFVRSTLPEEKAYLFVAEVDKEPFESLRDRVAFIIEENVPVSLAKSVFDFEIIGNIKGKEKLKVAVSVLPTKAVELYIDLYKSAGVSVASFEVESQALARAIIPNGDDRAILIVNLGENKTGLYVVEDEVVQFSSTPTFGVSKLGEEYKDLLNLKGEIRKVMAFWNTRLDTYGVPAKKIEKVFVTGRWAKDDKFVFALMDDMDIDYEVANVWVNALSLSGDLPSLSFDESLAYGVAIGMALPEKEPRYV